jgi:rhodanese-related sulfurtransferase
MDMNHFPFAVSMANVAGATLAALFVLAAAIAGYRWYKMSIFSVDPRDPAVTLGRVEQAVFATFGAPEITAGQLASLISKGGTILFDVREEAEYGQSHIEGAIRILPDMAAAHFKGQFGPILVDKVAVFYCAVGVRSAIMLNRVRSSIASPPPAALYTLRGGIFRWFSEGRPVAGARGAAAGVHPYDAAWGTLLERTLHAPSGLRANKDAEFLQAALPNDL